MADESPGINVIDFIDEVMSVLVETRNRVLREGSGGETIGAIRLQSEDRMFIIQGYGKVS
jgi:hypothetical protein